MSGDFTYFDEPVDLFDLHKIIKKEHGRLDNDTVVLIRTEDDEYFALSNINIQGSACDCSPEEEVSEAKILEYKIITVV